MLDQILHILQILLLLSHDYPFKRLHLILNFEALLIFYLLRALVLWWLNLVSAAVLAHNRDWTRFPLLKHEGSVILLSFDRDYLIAIRKKLLLREL